jgi:glucose-6-phosphate isomerase
MSAVSLKKSSGLPIALDLISGNLLPDDQEEVLFDVSTRTLEAAKDYYINHSKYDLSMELYKMYRGIRLTKDSSLIESGRIRHDITVVMPGKINGEYIKTIGHIHPIMKDQKIENRLRYPEIYSVIYGTAYYIIQKYSDDLKSIVKMGDVQVEEVDESSTKGRTQRRKPKKSHEPQ